jgi:DNA-binding transcriptional ArsR family regulator
VTQSKSDTLFRTLADPTRWRILDLLAERGPMNVGQLASAFPDLVVSGISKHVMGLRAAGLVSADRHGRQQIYRLEPMRWPLHWHRGLLSTSSIGVPLLNACVALRKRTQDMESILRKMFEEGNEMVFIDRFFILILFFALQGSTQDVKTAYPTMAPLAQYLMPRDTEISLARSAAPKSASDDVKILILTPSGYRTAVKGANGFVCMIARSWSADFDSPDFWDPKLRAPICYNALAAQSQVPATLKRTQVALAGGSRAQVLKAIKAAIESGELPTAKAGLMSYMLSKQTYLCNLDGHWLPHLMFFTPEAAPQSWGAGPPGSPILGIRHPEEHLTVFIIPLGTWSDGTTAMSEKH